MMHNRVPANRCFAIPGLFLCLFILSGCLPVMAMRELAYRPSPSDPYGLWSAYITDSGLILLCGSVDNDREGMERVNRVYNLELRLNEDHDLQPLKSIQVVQIADHPSLQMTKGYLTDLCQFDEKRVTRRPGETGWIEIFMNSWDEGYIKIYPADIAAGRLPNPPSEPRAVLFPVLDSDPPQYLLMGQLRKDEAKRTVLFILGSGHIEAMW